MKAKIRFFSIILITFFAINDAFCKSVKIVVVGTGKSSEEAKNNALRSALEQVSGAFVSSNSSVTNNLIQNDEISTITNGSIEKYTLLDNSKYDGGYSVTVLAIVSPENLASYISKKTSTIAKVESALFLSNAKQMELNSIAEEKAVKNICAVFEKLLDDAYDFIKLSATQPSINPHLRTSEVDLSMNVVFKVNKKINVAKKYLLSNLKKIAMDDNEANEYKRYTGKDPIRQNIGNEILFFRNKRISCNIDPWRNFKITDGNHTYKLCGESYHSFCDENYTGHEHSYNFIDFDLVQKQPIQQNYRHPGTLSIDFSFPSKGEKNSVLLKFRYSKDEFAKVTGFKILN